MPTLETTKPTRRKLKRLDAPGATREPIHEHEESHASARMVRVETGGVDRETGKATRTFYEVTTKLRGQPETTRTFSAYGDPGKAEWNARVVYLAAQHGITDLATPLGEIGPRLWHESGNMKRLEALAPVRDVIFASRTRINSGDPEPDCASEGGACPSGRLCPDPTHYVTLCAPCAEVAA